MRSRAHRGHSLVETVVATAITAVVVGVAVSLMAAVRRADAVAVPMTNRLWDRARAANEIQAAVTDAAAERAYFDLQATIAALRPPSATGPTVAADKGGGGGGSGEPPRAGHRTVQPVVSFGTGVRVGASLTIAGPVAVTDAERPLFPNQVGDALSILRTMTPKGPLHLGADFDSSTGFIRLVAAGTDARNAVADLTAEDVLVITGRSGDGSVVTAVAGILGPAEPVAMPTPQTEDGVAVFSYYQLRVTGPGDTCRWGLGNSGAAAAGVVLGRDASVALVDRSEGVVTYYTSGPGSEGYGRGSRSIVLHRVVGDPRAPLEDESLVEPAGAPLDASLLWSDGSVTESTIAPPPGAAAVLASVTVAVPVLVGGTGPSASETAESEMLELTVEVLNSMGARSRMPVWFGVFADAPASGAV
jgi:hypothetical protein